MPTLDEIKQKYEGSDKIVLTEDEMHERLTAQGVSREDLAFKCPMCGTIQSGTMLLNAGAAEDVDEVMSYVGFSCIGRFTGAGNHSHHRHENPGRGCNWTLGGLFQTNKIVVYCKNGDVCPMFEPATPEEAQALRESLKVGTDAAR